MKQYYFTHKSQKLGPFSLADLRMQNLTPNTLIWYDGLQEWLPAKEIPELKDLFLRPEKPNKTNPWLIPFIALLVVLTLIIGIWIGNQMRDKPNENQNFLNVTDSVD